MSKLSKNIIYNLLGQGLLLILGFVAVKFVFKQLGADALGIIYFTLTLNAVLGAVLEMGVCSTATREVAAHFKDEPDYIRDLVRTGSLFYWSACILLAVVIYFIAPLLVEKWINLKTMDAATATRMLQVLGVASVVGLPRSLYISILQGLQRMEFRNIIDVATSGVQQFGIIVILAMGGELFHVVYWLALCFGLSLVGYLFVCLRFFSWQVLVPAYSADVIKRNKGYAKQMMQGSIFAMIHTQADKLIISKLLPVGILGYYSFGYGFVAKGSMVTGAIAQAVFPSLSSLFKIGDRTRLVLQYRKMHDLTCYVTVPIFAALIFSELPLFTYFLNEEVARTLLMPITFLCIGFYMNGTLSVPYVFSLAVGKPDISVRLNFLALFFVPPGTAILIYFFGLSGAGFSWIVYHLFAYAYGVPMICKECLEMPVSNWYLHVLKIVILTIGTYGLAWLFVASRGTYTLPILCSAYFGASGIYLIGASQMIGEDLRVALFALLRTLKAKPARVA